jgi:hypothetical protein
MPDTKSGREKKGKDKRRQLENRLAKRELTAEDEPPEPEGIDGDLLAEDVDADADLDA